jgi:5'-3' exonuclease
VLGAQDKDDYQCLKGKHVLMYDSAHKNKESKPDPIYITEADLMEREGLTPAQFLQYQILLGDKIDSIPRIGTFKPLQIKKGLIEHGTIADWYAAADADVKKMFDMNRVAIKRNRKLVTLKTDVLPPTEPDEWKPPKAKSFEAQSLPSTYHAWHSQLYPKSRGLF